MIFIYDDLQAMSGGAAELVAGRARAAGSCLLPVARPAAAARRHPLEQGPRVLGRRALRPPDDERSNARMARRTLLERVPQVPVIDDGHLVNFALCQAL